MSYNSLVYTEQGASVLRLEAGGSLVSAEESGFSVRGVQFFRGSDVPTFNANAGDVYMRAGSAAGSAARLYINTSNGANGGSVWKGASIFS